jgi:hypothetical protein
MGNDDLQFDQAEPAEEGASQELVCTGCKLEIGDNYYIINGNIVCPRCKDLAETTLVGGSRTGRVLRAAVYGSLAAAVGSFIWYEVAKLTGYQFSLIAIVIGLMVGFAVRKGCRGRGGWFYQGMAMFLTYFAIAVTNLPAVFQAIEEQQPKGKQTQAAPVSVAEQRQESSSGADQPKSAEAPAPPRMDAAAIGLGLLALFVLAMISPFLYGFSGILGIVIIGIGLYEAWKINRRRAAEISGPFQISMHGREPAVG